MRAELSLKMLVTLKMRSRVIRVIFYTLSGGALRGGVGAGKHRTLDGELLRMIFTDSQHFLPL